MLSNVEQVGRVNSNYKTMLLVAQHTHKPEVKEIYFLISLEQGTFEYFN